MSSPAELRSLAEAVAREAGAQLREAAAGPVEALASKSSPTDLVSAADEAAEALIGERLAAARPGDGFLGEEGGSTEGTSGLRWIVDPLDGTINFLFGLPQWAVSIACEDADGVVAGAIYDPRHEELFSAQRGGAPLLNGRPVERRPPADSLATALVATGFGYRAEVRRAQAEILTRLLPEVRDIRRFGSAALDLAWTAAGRYDAYYEFGVHRWDVAAGQILCEAAGLAYRELPASGVLPAGVAVAPPALLDDLLALLA
jgi:myo-inositol-1(or 4)-monophosphatase